MAWPFAEFKSMVKYSLFVDSNCKVFLNTLENGLTLALPGQHPCWRCLQVLHPLGAAGKHHCSAGTGAVMVPAELH